VNLDHVPFDELVLDVNLDTGQVTLGRVPEFSMISWETILLADERYLRAEDKDTIVVLDTLVYQILSSEDGFALVELVGDRRVPSC